MDPHWQETLDLVRHITDTVGREILDLRREARTQISNKRGVDVVTNADTHSEQRLSTFLQRHFPDHAVRCEEGTALGPANSDWVWHVDPLDGTANYARDIANWTISVGLAHHHQPFLGVVHAPYWGGSVYGGQGLGGWNNDDPLAPAKPLHKNQAHEWIIATDWSWDISKRVLSCRMLEYLAPYIRQYKTFGSSCLDQFNLAKGLIDAYVISGVHPWDLAAGCAVLKTLGFSLLTWQGAPWDLSHGDIIACRPGMEELLLQACAHAQHSVQTTPPDHHSR